jgi:hypothetical protein
MSASTSASGRKNWMSGSTYMIPSDDWAMFLAIQASAYGFTAVFSSITP